MTEKLYDTQPYGRSFTAQIVSVREEGERMQVILDRTLFFPEEGGQTPDTGILGGCKVTDVQIGRDDVITHTLECDETQRQKLLPGVQVRGEIDWTHRFTNMQNHSGEHILSGLMHNLYGFENVGFHLSESEMTLDLSGVLSPEQLQDLETRANQVVWSNLPIDCRYPAAEELAQLEYRSKKEIDGAVRIVTIPGVDVCACCAPHVARTGEIGLIKILRMIRTKEGMRLWVVCGSRALSLMQVYQQQIEEVSHLTDRPREEAGSAVQKVFDRLSDQKQLSSDLQRRLVELRLSQVPTDQENVVLFAGDLQPLVQRNAVNTLMESHAGFCAVFVGEGEDWHYILGMREGDSRQVNQILREKLGARGGGKPAMVQGSVHASEQAIRQALGAEETPEKSSVAD